MSTSCASSTCDNQDFTKRKWCSSATYSQVVFARIRSVIIGKAVLSAHVRVFPNAFDEFNFFAQKICAHAPLLPSSFAAANPECFLDSMTACQRLFSRVNFCGHRKIVEGIRWQLRVWAWGCSAAYRATSSAGYECYGWEVVHDVGLGDCVRTGGWCGLVRSIANPLTNDQSGAVLTIKALH